MLQTITPGHFVPPIPFATTQTKPQARVQTAPSLRDMIDQYREVKAELAIAKGQCTRLYKKFPDLEERRPLIKICDRVHGEPMSGRWLDDFDRIYPARQQQTSSAIRAKRRNFKKRCEEALIDHKLAREAAGIESAERQRGRARGKQSILFRKINNFAPASKTEAGLVAAFLLKELPHFIEANNVFTNRPPKTSAGYQHLMNNQALAFYFVVDALRAIAKA